MFIFFKVQGYTFRNKTYNCDEKKERCNSTSKMPAYR